MVSAIGQGNSSNNAYAVQQARSQVADRIFKQADGNQEGKITEDELTAAMESRGDPKTAAAAIFKQLDQGNKEYLTRQDLEAALEQKPASPGGTAASGVASTAIYDPQDLNQDGQVTSQENLQYAANLYAQQKEASPKGKQTDLIA